MKKFIASILAVYMVLTTFGFTAIAYETAVDPDREIVLEVDTSELYAKEYVTVTVKLKSTEDVAQADYILTYNPEYFKFCEKTPLVSGGYKIDETAGTIEHHTWIESAGYFELNQTFATYKFEAIAQEGEVSDLFAITNAHASNRDEGMDDMQVPVAGNSEEVTILLIDYTVKKYVDGNLVDETAGEVEEYEPFHYDDATHSFKVETVPEATVSYEVKYTAPDGTVTTSSDVDNIKAEGTYEISYKVTNKADGYAPVEETFTITILKPDYVVEVGVEDYVDNKALVLVYTNTPNVHFSYGNKDWEMVNVSGNEYKYDDPRTTAVEAETYTYVFAYVAEPTANDTIEEYEANIINWYNGDTDSTGAELENPLVGEYTADINDNKNLTVDDITVAFGIANGYEPYYTTDKYQYRILRLDYDNDKQISGTDTGYVVSEVKAELGLE